MISNSLSPQLDLSTVPHRFRNLPHFPNRFQRIKAKRVCPSNLFAKLSEPIFLQKSVVPFAASIAILFFSNPGNPLSPANELSFKVFSFFKNICKEFEFKPEKLDERSLSQVQQPARLRVMLELIHQP